MLFWFIISIMILAFALLSARSFSKNRWLALSILILIPIISLFFYLKSGRYAQWQQHLLAQKNIETAKTDIKNFGKPQTLIHQLEEKVKTSPQDSRAWYFLGKLYLTTGQNVKAVEVLTQAKKLAPSDIDIGFLHTEASFSVHHLLTKEQEAFLKKLSIQKQAYHLQALNLLALDAYHKKDYQLAIKYWETILSQLPDESEDKKTIREMISRAKNVKLSHQIKGITHEKILSVRT